MNRIQLPPDSETLYDLGAGRVLASRINDVLARPSTKRYQSYLELINRQVRGFDDRDPADAFRERDLVPRALQAYEIRNRTTLERGYFFQHSSYEFLGCTPDAVENDEIGYTAHIRATEDTYEKAVEDNMSAQYTRTAQAAMAVTGLKFWVHLDYWEDEGLRRRRLTESLFCRSPMADELLNRMAWFYCDACQCHLRTA